MIKIRIEFINERDLIEMTHHISEKYEIIEKGRIKDSQKKDSKYKFQFLDLMKKVDVNEKEEKERSNKYDDQGNVIIY